MDKGKFLTRLKVLFNKDDKKEPYLDREYVDETNRLFDLLINTDGDVDNPTDKAVFDIVMIVIDSLSIIAMEKRGKNNGN